MGGNAGKSCEAVVNKYVMFFSLMMVYRNLITSLLTHFFSISELPENWTDTRETILEGMTFNLRHLGMTLVDQPKGEDLSAAAVKRIVATVRARLLTASVIT